MRRLLLLTLLVGITQSLSAQRGFSGGLHFAPPRPAAANRFSSGSGFGAFGGFNGHRSFSSPVLLLDAAYADVLYDSGYPVASQPPVIILQAPPRADSAQDRPPLSPSPQPLMIELQGDRYVRVSGDAQESNSARMIDVEPASLARADRPSDAGTRAAAPRELPPVVLVFRDGHREEVSDYTIADGALYTRGDYYTDGSWTRKIQLFSLNLPETAQANVSRGVRFQLPSAPNEVIIRP